MLTHRGFKVLQYVMRVRDQILILRLSTLQTFHLKNYTHRFLESVMTFSHVGEFNLCDYHSLT